MKDGRKIAQGFSEHKTLCDSQAEVREILESLEAIEREQSNYAAQFII